MEVLLGAVAKEAASTLISAVLNKAGPSLLEFLRASSKLNSSVDKLVKTLSSIRSVLEKADQKPEWLNDLKDAVYEAEGVLDEMEYEWLKRQVRFVKTPLRFTQFSFLLRVREIQEKLDNCLETANRIGTLSVNLKSESAQIVECSNFRETSSLPDSRLIGRVGEKEFIINWLLNGHMDSEASSANVHQDTPVLPIWGMGGIGKTTIAQQVFNDDRVKTQFKSWRAWVYVSEKFDVNKIIKDIIEILSLSNENGSGDSFQSTTSLEVLQQKLVNILQGKIFLIVLDDVWNEEPEMWNKLCKFFKSGKPGSKILVTCRSEKTASLVATNTKEKQYIDSLGTSDFWELFKMHAFGDHSSGSQSSLELETIGREIADKLRGSPLAAKTIGRILKENLNTAHWTSVAGSELWVLKQDQSGIMPALLLSYKYLPEHLKPCFTYFASLPKGCQIIAKELIRRYIAIEFVQKSSGQNDQFSVGLEYVNELLNRSLFQQGNDKFGYDSWIGIHDLLYELAQMVTKDDIFVITDNSFTAIPKGVRHLSIYLAASPIDWMKIISQVNIKALHSLTIIGDSEDIPEYFDRKYFYELVNTFLGKAINLKMVRLNTLLITTIPDTIENLKRLRYLSISATMITTLPKALGRLYHLQYFDIIDCDKLQILPKEMENLSSLIDFEGRHDLLPVKCFRLLQHVDRLTFKVSSGEGAKVRDLGGLRGIRWLKIEGLENISSKEEAMEAKLEHKTYLDTLECHWSPDESLRNDGSNPENTLEGLRPSSELRSLEIINYRGDACPSWIGGRYLQNLRYIEFTNCTRLKKVSALGEFQESIEVIILQNCVQLHGTPLLGNPNFFPPCVKTLCICKCGEFGNSLQWTHLVHLTLLQKLYLGDCENIECLPIETLQSLTYLYVSNCKKLTTKEGTEGLRGLTFLETISITECPTLMDDLVKTRHGFPSSLKTLIVCDQNLVSLPIEVFSSVHELYIVNCPKLGPPKISNEELHNLNTFAISKAKMGSVKEWLLFLRSCKLRHLCLAAISDLLSFSNDDMEDLLAGLRSLLSLHLIDLEHIRSVPSNLAKHPSLKQVEICNCPNIISLSTSMFPSSTALTLDDCPKLLKQLPKKGFTEFGPSRYLSW